jgi:hypothetical protein
MINHCLSKSTLTNCCVVIIVRTSETNFYYCKDIADTDMTEFVMKINLGWNLTC